MRENIVNSSDFKKRYYGIDVLRLLLMYAVVIIHILGHGGILESVEIGDSSMKYNMYYLIKVIVTCSVDCYALISGFVSSNKETQNYSKIIVRWAQVVFYSFVLSLVLAVFGMAEIKSGKTLIRLVFPVTGGGYWYFTCFFALFFLQPYINRMLNSLCDKELKKLFGVLLILFSFQSVVTDPYHMNVGFSAAWIIVLYILGNIMRRINLLKRIKCGYLCLLFVTSVMISWLPIVAFRNTTFTSCLSPTMVFQGMVLIELFSRLQKVPAFLTKISSLAFGVYLFHENNYVRTLIVKDKFLFVKDLNLIQGYFVVLGSALLIFFIGLFIDEFRTALFRTINMEGISNSFCKWIQRKWEKDM